MKLIFIAQDHIFLKISDQNIKIHALILNITDTRRIVRRRRGWSASGQRRSQHCALHRPGAGVYRHGHRVRRPWRKRF